MSSQVSSQVYIYTRPDWRRIRQDLPSHCYKRKCTRLEYLAMNENWFLESGQGEVHHDWWLLHWRDTTWWPSRRYERVDGYARGGAPPVRHRRRQSDSTLLSEEVATLFQQSHCGEVTINIWRREPFRTYIQLAVAFLCTRVQYANRIQMTTRGLHDLTHKV